MRGADALIRALERAGVETVFGIPGGACLPVYDALHDSPIRHVLMRHEAAAGHAAEGYARATGRVGVAIATSGPGATNLVTPIADASMDSVPTLFITGQVKTTLRGTDAFQEADVIGITQPIVKHSIGIERADDVAQAVRDALHLAITGRPGPVLIDLPNDIATAPARDDTHEPYLPGHRPRLRPNGRQIRWAAEALAAARRPVLYAGGGVVQAGGASELTTLARVAGLPVTTTLMALGAFPSDDPQWLGMLGMHGTRVANWAMDEADLIVAIGARFDDRVTGALDEFAPNAKIVHIDVDATEIGKNVPVHIPIVGDARLSLEALSRAYEKLEPDVGRLAEWWSRIRGWQAAHPQREPDAPADGCVAPETALDALASQLGDAIVTTDVGQHQMWAAARLRFKRAAALDHQRRSRDDGLRPAGGARRAGGVPGIDGRVRLRRRLVADERAGAGDRRRGGAAGEDPPARQRLARDGPPAAGPVLGRPPHRGRPRREPRLGAPRPCVRRLRPARSATRTRSKTHSPRRSPRTARHSCTSGSRRRRTACRCSARAEPPER